MRAASAFFDLIGCFCHFALDPVPVRSDAALRKASYKRERRAGTSEESSFKLGFVSRRHAPAFKAKVPLAATKGDRTLASRE
jgi:hypothetical protein